jgi:MFS family permease
MEKSQKANGPSRESLVGLNAANFFLAELAGVVGPFLALYLKQKNWDYVHIGVATAVGGFGTLLLQAPAGYLCGVVPRPRFLLGFMSLILGVAFAILPVFSAHHWWVFSLLFIAGGASAFFVPLLSALALALAGPEGLPRLTGQNQSWNHLGNIAAALMALVFVSVTGLESIFYVTALVSFLALGSLLFIRTSEVNLDRKMGLRSVSLSRGGTIGFLQQRQVVLLLVSVMLFHVANAPVLPLLGLYLKALGGSDQHFAWTVLIAQAVMIPTALLGVVIVLMCSDLAGDRAGFGLLMGLSQTALALGGCLGPLLQGFATQYWGFRVAFAILALIAASGTGFFLGLMKETSFKSF